LAAILACGAVSACSPLSIAVGAGAKAGVAVAQERTTQDALSDAGIELTVNSRLLDHSADLFADVETEVVEGRVLLLGTVPTPEQRIKASEIAWSVDGVREVTNEMQVSEGSGIVGYAEDVAISTRVRARLIGDGAVKSINYNVETVEGVVHLIGVAVSGEELRRVTQLASTVPGVKKVVSHVLVLDDPRRKRV
jgi:osmotically-inducible protein OsmY